MAGARTLDLSSSRRGRVQSVLLENDADRHQTKHDSRMTLPFASDKVQVMHCLLEAGADQGKIVTGQHIAHIASGFSSSSHQSCVWFASEPTTSSKFSHLFF